jgi:hypothetical protein
MPEEKKPAEKQKTFWDNVTDHPWITLIVTILVCTAFYMLFIKVIDKNNPGQFASVLALREFLQANSVWLVIAGAVLAFLVYVSRNAVKQKHFMTVEQMQKHTSNWLFATQGLIVNPNEIMLEEYPSGTAKQIVRVPHLNLVLEWDQAFSGKTILGRDNSGFKTMLVDKADMFKRMKLKDDYERMMMLKGVVHE